MDSPRMGNWADEDFFFLGKWYFWKWIPPEEATGRKKKLFLSRISENGFPRRGNWAEEELNKTNKVRFLKTDSPEGATGRKKSFSKKIPVHEWGRRERWWAHTLGNESYGLDLAFEGI